MSHPNRKLVAEFHSAFGCFTEAEDQMKPQLGEVDSEDRRDLRYIANQIRLMAEFAHRCAESTQGTPANNTFLRVQLMAEELSEVIEALALHDLTEVAHELADLEYVVQGTVLSFGLDGVFERCVSEIHRANMSKLEDGKPLTNEAGRVVKGRDFRPACVRDIVLPRKW